jgi:hypothetical protein
MPDQVMQNYAAAAMTGVAAGAGSTGLAGSSIGTGAGAGAAAVESVAGFSKGATGVGSSILGGCSSTFAGVETSCLGFGLKKSPTRAERRRPTLLLAFSSFGFSSF